MEEIVFDPSLFIADDEEQTNDHQLLLKINYLSKVVNFISKYLSKKPYAYTNYFISIMYKIRDYPLNRFSNYRSQLVKIQKQILNNVNYSELLLIESSTPAQPDFQISFPDCDSKDAFLKTISYAYDHQIELILFFSEKNQVFERPVYFSYQSFKLNYYPIYDPFTDFNFQLIKYLLQSEKLNIFPTDMNPFPNCFICREYNELISKLTQTYDKYETLSKIGIEVAMRNNYVLDEELSKINQHYSQAKRTVFRSNGNSSLYISIDYESGGFELFDRSGIHQGQYSFSGNKIKEASPIDHKLVFKIK